MGEQIKVRLITDNTDVKKGLERTKVMLKQEIAVTASHYEMWTETKTKKIKLDLASAKGEKCGPYQMHE